MNQRRIPRRSFLRSCGLLGLAAAAAPLVPLAPAAEAAVRIGPSLVKASRTEPLMGTFVTITALHDSATLCQEAVGTAFEDMRQRIRTFDRFDEASPVALFNAEGTLRDTPPELMELVRRAREIHGLTAGAFDPTVKPVIDLFRARDQGGDAFRIPAAERERLLELVDFSKVRASGSTLSFARPGMGMTLDGVAKGYIADKASETLTRMGAANHLVNAGGDIRLAGDRRLGAPWTVAVQNPGGGEPSGMIRMRSGAVATSGAYEISFDQHRVHHHIVDPRTALSPAGAASATVSAASVMLADALATAVFVLPPRAGFELIDSLSGAQGLIITNNGTALPTRGWAITNA